MFVEKFPLLLPLNCVCLLLYYYVGTPVSNLTSSVSSPLRPSGVFDLLRFLSNRRSPRSPSRRNDCGTKTRSLWLKCEDRSSWPSQNLVVPTWNNVVGIFCWCHYLVSVLEFVILQKEKTGGKLFLGPILCRPPNRPHQHVGSSEEVFYTFLFGTGSCRVPSFSPYRKYGRSRNRWWVLRTKVWGPTHKRRHLRLYLLDELRLSWVVHRVLSLRLDSEVGSKADLTLE